MNSSSSAGGADLQFLIIALRRLRRAAEIVVGVTVDADAVEAAIAAFDNALPNLRKMRNVGEHVDAYAVDHPRRNHKDIDRRQLQVGAWNGTTYSWLGVRLNIDQAHAAAETLFGSLQLLVRQNQK